MKALGGENGSHFGAVRGKNDCVVVGSSQRCPPLWGMSVSPARSDGKIRWYRVSHVLIGTWGIFYFLGSKNIWNIY